ncbi:MAG: C4-dicarboxylate transporter DcuC [Bacteriodetes bacterium]|nr:C4-dicarboxylate transporter DcuC [Bacteroidota bacterium]
MEAIVLVLALCICGAALYAIYRGVDVRLVLFSAGLLLALLKGLPLAIFDAFFKTMGDGKIIGPICSAMGFAFVLRATGADQEMVRLLLAPLQRYRWLLIPGGCAVGFVTNMAITSQTAAAAAVGPILIPLMLAARFHPLVAAGTLVLGCSAGGNLFNPGEPDVVNVQQAVNVPVHEVINNIVAPELAGFVVAVMLFILITRKFGLIDSDVQSTEHSKPINYLKALLPPLPVAIVFACLPQFGLFPELAKLYPDGLPVSHAMIFSTFVTMLVVRKDISPLTKQFFEGLGYGYVHVISLIIAASCFIKGLETVGLITALVGAISGNQLVGNIMSLFSPLGLAVLSGSGTAPSVSFSKAVLPQLTQTMGVATALDAGTLGAIGATFGRTMSPVAAIVIFTSTLCNVPPKDIVKSLAVPLLVGAVVALVVVMML